MRTWLKRHSQLYQSMDHYIMSLHKEVDHFKYKSFLFLVFGVVFSHAFASWGGYQYALLQNNNKQVNMNADPNIELSSIEYHYEQSEQYLAMVTQQVGRIEANIMRLNALGQRLVESAHLSEEFDFNQEVGMGGILVDEGKEDLLTTLKELDALLDKRYAQMTALRQAIQHHIGKKELSFSGAGKMVANGWISSFFGVRHDPFSGRKAWHSGVDIVGKEGSEIRALASGVVSYSDVKGGYGRLVEINHGNGLATRYGHAQKLLVKSGEVVRKGQTIALLGSSGRSTGPHVHVEVHKDGKAVDPGLYFPDFRPRKQGA